MKSFRSPVCRGLQRLATLGHHLTVTVVIGSLLLILEHFGLTNWIDSAALRLAVAANGPGTNASNDSSVPTLENSDLNPLVLTITERLYEQEFDQVSPLDRRRLGVILAAVAAGRPTEVVVDIDLSPTATDVGSPSSQVELNRQLLSMVRTGTRVVLVVPRPVATDAAFERNAQWLQEMCSAGIHFGFADVLLSQGVALRVNSAYPSLSVVAANDESTPVEHSHGRHAERLPTPCEMVSKGKDSAAFLSSLYPSGATIGASDLEAQVPLDAAFLSQRQRFGVPLNSISDLGKLPSLASRVVFLGGTYDAGDTFVTAAGEAAGVWVHAASYQALVHPSKRLDRIAAFLFDIVLGLLSGAAFTFGWGRYNHLARQLAASGPTQLRVYLGARFWLVFNVATLIVAVMAVFLLSALLLQRHLWNNPAGMLIGVFIDAIVGSRTHALAPKAHGARHGAAGWRGNWPRILDTLFLMPIVFYAAWLLFVG